MKTLYLSQQGCYLCLEKELLLIKKHKQIINKIQLPLILDVQVFKNKLIKQSK